MSQRISKLLLCGIILTLLGGICALIEHIFYDYVDENGVLHESLFLPLSFFLAFIGFITISIWIVLKIVRILRHRDERKL